MISKYIAQIDTWEVQGRGFLGIAYVQWREGDDIFMTTMRFGEPCETREKALELAASRVDMRARNDELAR